MKLSLRTLIEALRTHRGPTTRALDLIFTPPYSGPGENEVLVEGALNTPLADWGVGLMLGAGGGVPEVLHINAWPNLKKEQLRSQVLAPAVENGTTVRFFWKPYGGTVPDIEVGEIKDGKVEVTFLTPWSAIIQSSLEEVEVGL